MKGEKAMDGKRVRTTHVLFTRGLDIIPAGTVAWFGRPGVLRRPIPHSRWRRWETIISGVNREDFELLPEEAT